MVEVQYCRIKDQCEKPFLSKSINLIISYSEAASCNEIEVVLVKWEPSQHHLHLYKTLFKEALSYLDYTTRKKTGNHRHPPEKEDDPNTGQKVIFSAETDKTILQLDSVRCKRTPRTSQTSEFSPFLSPLPPPLSPPPPSLQEELEVGGL